jgi:translation initiation factor RLI1
MLCYGKPEELIRIIQREIELLSSLINIDKKLDSFIKKKLELLNVCMNQIKKLPGGEYQIVAVESCEIIPL